MSKLTELAEKWRNNGHFSFASSLDEAIPEHDALLVAGAYLAASQITWEARKVWNPDAHEYGVVEKRKLDEFAQGVIRLLTPADARAALAEEVRKATRDGAKAVHDALWSEPGHICFPKRNDSCRVYLEICIGPEALSIPAPADAPNMRAINREVKAAEDMRTQAESKINARLGCGAGAVITGPADAPKVHAPDCNSRLFNGPMGECSCNHAPKEKG